MDFDAILNDSVDISGDVLCRIGKKDFLHCHLADNYDALFRDYPQLFEDNPNEDHYDAVAFLVRRVLADDRELKCSLINYSFKAYEKVSRVCIRVSSTDSPYLSAYLTPDLSIYILGNVTSDRSGNYTFNANDVEISNSEHSVTTFEQKVTIKPHFDYTIYSIRTMDLSLLGNFMNSSTSVAVYTEERLTHWEEYLKWKKYISQQQIKGCKYIRVTYDSYDRLLKFLLVFSSKEEYNKQQNLLRKNDLQVFSNGYSKDRFKFKFNSDIDRFDLSRGVALGRLHSIDATYFSYEIPQIDDQRFGGYEDFFKKKKHGSDDENEEVDSPIDLTLLDQEYEEPYLVEASYKLSDALIDDENDFIDYDDDELEDIVIDNFFRRVETEGYLSVSSVQDFVLNARLSQAISDFKKTASTRQALWLFDILKAPIPPKNQPRIEMWKNPSLNQSQREAVQKMLDAPEVCLIQGPPGTGKTTVIAEAIYQFVKQGKRVLLSSQAHLAVDNALERIKDDPIIRVLRLGKEERIDEEIYKKYCEEKALWTYFSSISSAIEQKWTTKWADDKRVEDDILSDTELVSRAIKEWNEIKTDISAQRKRFVEVSRSKEDKKEQYNKLYRKQNGESISSQHVDALCSSLSGAVSQSISLNYQQLCDIVPIVNEELHTLSQNGIILRRSNIRVPQDDEFEINRTNQALVDLCRKKNLVLNLCASVSKSSDDESSLADIEDLEGQIRDLDDRIDEAEGTDLEKLVNERKELKAELKQLKSSASISSLSENDRELFSDELLSLLEDPSHSFKDNFKSLAAGIIIAIGSFSANIVSQIEVKFPKQTNDYEAQLNEILAAITSLESTLDEMSKEIETIEVVQNEKEEKVLSVSKKYHSNQDEILNTLKELFAKHQIECENNGASEKVWGDIVRGFQSRLGNERDEETEAEYFYYHFVHTCNVVGVSCTENPKTLSGKGFGTFDVVIIDEVSKATPPELLIPMLRGKKTILVGDHRQLPPLFGTNQSSYEEILEERAMSDDISEEDLFLTKEKYSDFKDMVTSSLFQEYFESADESIRATLTKQFRMHPQIEKVINRFYEGKLEHPTEEDTPPRWLESKEHGVTLVDLKGREILNPQKHVLWMDSSELVQGKPYYESRRRGSNSAENFLEQEIIRKLLIDLDNEYQKQGYGKNDLPKLKIGVITFYGDQKRGIVSSIKRGARSVQFQAIDVNVNTVDRFQGREQEVIIVSLVRNKPVITEEEKIKDEAFVKDFRRINVAFSRAQKLLIIVGAEHYFSKMLVRLPSMSAKGQERRVQVYADIIDDLTRNGEFTYGYRLIDDDAIKGIRAKEAENNR